MLISENVPIKNLVTMRIGGPAKYVIEIKSKDEIPEAYQFAAEKNLPVTILGNGANTFATDEGYQGVILLDRILGISQLSEKEIEAAYGAEVRTEAEKEGYGYFRANGGEIWDSLVNFTAALGYSGIEAMAGIPGTAGASPVQNIGAYGQEVTQVIVSADVYDLKEKTFKTILAEDMQMSYRKSIFNSGESVGRYFIYSIVIRLKKGQLNPPFYRSLQAYVDEHQETDFSPTNIARMVREVRNSKLPDPEKIASAGSFFKNIYLTDEEADEAEARGIEVWRNAKEVGPDSPEKRTNLVNSGWLLEHAGLKGQVFHGMKVSEKAALILINESAETYADLAAARAEVAKIVFDKFGLKIEQEPDEIK